MQHKYLECFLALAKYKNFSEAAEEMYISQSSFSKNIKKLETDLNVQLFNRGSAGVSLTEYGQSYLPYARKIINLYQQAERELAQLKSREEAVKVGTIPSAAEYGILDFLIKFMNETGYQCQISTSPSGQLEDELADGQLDFAFIKNCQNKHFEHLPYQSDQLMVVLPATDPLAGQKSIKLEQLQNRNFILEPVKSRPYQLCLSLCQAAGFNPKVIYTDHYIENITAFVKKGLGVSLLMGKVIPADPELKAIPVLPNTTAKITVCYLPKVVPNSGQEALLKYLQHYCRSLKIE